MIIRWSLYLLFFLVPLWFFAGSYELFEYNKMMLVYALTVVVGAAWIIKMIKERKWLIRRTYLTIPLFIYLGAHILSMIFSIDPHVSVWGYYSRFHEGLLATTSYIILYLAAVSNLEKKDVIRILMISFASGVIVSIWGAMEHFGGSPSCLLITGKLDDACWVQDVKNRVFATLGQPNWMAAYLDVLILVALGFRRKFSILALLFAALLFTKSRSGLLGLIAGLAVFGISNLSDLKKISLVLVTMGVAAILFGLPFSQIENFNLEHFLATRGQKTPMAIGAKPAVDTGYIDIGISESGDIRKIVWEGAVKVWERYPIFGSGVETFAYAYYLDRPVAHNMVSEWDFLYNKAHNEFLNILATTGTVGFLSYLGILGSLSYWFIKKRQKDFLVSALFAAWISILVTNFFGFSVVIIGLFFFLIPAFTEILSKEDPSTPLRSAQGVSAGQWVAIGVILIIGFFMELNLANMWLADKSFAYGKNLDGVNQYIPAYTYLKGAVAANPDEPTFRDEFSYNEAVVALAASKEGSSAAKLTNDLISSAVSDSNKVVEISPKALPFWKTRTKVFYTLATIDNKYLGTALLAIQQAAALAPTDAKVHYNLGLILGQSGQAADAIRVFEETVAMKPDYRDAHYALGLYYNQVGRKENAKSQMEFIINKIAPDADASKWLEENL